MNTVKAEKKNKNNRTEKSEPVAKKSISIKSPVFGVNQFERLFGAQIDRERKNNSGYSISYDLCNY